MRHRLNRPLDAELVEHEELADLRHLSPRGREDAEKEVLGAAQVVS